MTIDEAIAHAREVAENNRKESKYDAFSLDYMNETHKANCVKCAKEHEQLAEWLEELKQYKELEEQGLLLRLPCKVGDYIYVIPSQVNYNLNVLNGYSELNKVYKQPVHSIKLFNNKSYVLTTCDGLQSVVSNFYKETWFLTEEEAEQALEKIKKEV